MAICNGGLSDGVQVFRICRPKKTDVVSVIMSLGPEWGGRAEKSREYVAGMQNKQSNQNSKICCFKCTKSFKIVSCLFLGPTKQHLFKCLCLKRKSYSQWRIRAEWVNVLKNVEKVWHCSLCESRTSCDKDSESRSKWEGGEEADTWWDCWRPHCGLCYCWTSCIIRQVNCTASLILSKRWDCSIVTFTDTWLNHTCRPLIYNTVLKATDLKTPAIPEVAPFCHQRLLAYKGSSWPSHTEFLTVICQPSDLLQELSRYSYFCLHPAASESFASRTAR